MYYFDLNIAINVKKQKQKKTTYQSGHLKHWYEILNGFI